MGLKPTPKPATVDPMQSRIESELTKLKAQREQALANLNVIAGAIMLAEQLLKPEEDPTPATPATPTSEDKS